MKQDVILEKGTPAGNYYDKYNSSNPIVRKLMSGFYGSLRTLYESIDVKTVHEVGCGEGYLSSFMAEWKPERKIRASDHSKEVIEIAKKNAKELGIPVEFSAKDVYKMTKKDGADLIVCCEVLEHVEHPREVFKKLTELAGKYIIVSVPREPIWRALNLARGKYIADLGNTPGHIQHWSSGAFLKMISEHAEIVRVIKPLPWTMALLRVG